MIALSAAFCGQHNTARNGCRITAYPKVGHAYLLSRHPHAALVGQLAFPSVYLAQTPDTVQALTGGRCHWALDSGAFSELSAYGKWTLTPEEYVAAVRRYAKEIGHLDWAAPQDWMCEPFILAKTGLSVVEHQRRTIANYLRLKELAPDLPFAPVLQGWDLADYLACAAMYEAAGWISRRSR